MSLSGTWARRSVWYERLFGRPAYIVPNNDEVMWCVAGNGWLYVIPGSRACRANRRDHFGRRFGSVRHRSRQSRDQRRAGGGRR